MIILQEGAKMSQVRDVHHEYPSPRESTSKNWGKPIRTICSRITECEVHLIFAYDGDPKSKKIVNNLVRSVYELIQESKGGLEAAFAEHGDKQIYFTNSKSLVKGMTTPPKAE